MAMFSVLTVAEYVSLGQKHENWTTEVCPQTKKQKISHSLKKKKKKGGGGGADTVDNSIFFGKALLDVFAFLMYCRKIT